MKRVLIIAGSDSGGGAGIQADIKTCTVLGCYASTAITALTAQNTLGVHAIHPVPIHFIKQQIRVVLDDIGADAIKIGMLYNAKIINAVASVLKDCKIPIVLDPVMVAKDGSALLEHESVDCLKNTLIPMVTILTPNIPEAYAFLNNADKNHSSSAQSLLSSATTLLEFGSESILLKGGHMEGEVLYDVLVTKDDSVIFESRRINTHNTHGTGCTLSSAIASFIAKGLNIKDAVSQAREYVLSSIKSAPDIGKGKGPLNHLGSVDICLRMNFNKS